MNFNEKDCISWINEVSGSTAKNYSHLKDGYYLCNFLNKIQPGICKNVSDSNLIMNQRENVQKYLKGIKSLGAKNTFQPEDIRSFAKKNRVLRTIIELNDILKNGKKFKGPFLKKIQVQKSGWTGGLLDKKNKEAKEKCNYGINW